MAKVFQLQSSPCFFRYSTEQTQPSGLFDNMSVSAVILAVTLTLAVCLAAASPAGRLSQAREIRKTRAILPSAQLNRAEACCADLGCYSSGGEFFNLLNRPINAVPNCGIQHKLKLHLNTLRNPVKTQVLDPYNSITIQESNFDPTKKTQIIIHGFLDNFQLPWWKQTVLELLKAGDFNVIRLDWSSGNIAPYLQATANVRLVGSFAAKFINHIVTEYGVSPTDIHVIGHSLGAHGAGYAGAITQAIHNITIARITGLDPAGPYFTNLPTSVRLDPTDAEFVDTIVTDGEYIIKWAFGSHQPMGHINFYPNGGLDQPGCARGLLAGLWQGPTMNSTTFDLLGSVSATGFEAVACNHARAPVLFHESINNPACEMKSFECADYATFLRGECFTCKGQRCAVLGFHANSSIASKSEMKKYYTITTEKSPFCTSPHKVQFTLQSKTAANGAKAKKANIYVKLYGSLATSEKVLLATDIDLKPGQTYTFFFETAKELGVVQQIVFSWEAKIAILNPLEWLRTDYIHLEGDLLLTEQDELVSVFAPARSKVEEAKDLQLTLRHSYRQ